MIRAQRHGIYAFKRSYIIVIQTPTHLHIHIHTLQCTHTHIHAQRVLHVDCQMFQSYESRKSAQGERSCWPVIKPFSLVVPVRGNLECLKIRNMHKRIGQDVNKIYYRSIHKSKKLGHIFFSNNPNETPRKIIVKAIRKPESTVAEAESSLCVRSRRIKGSRLVR